ncbi:MAG TPA: NAD-dependent epimerase/dehydratase family protein, partial [Bryobacteraceae bacterium]|nr:NAD-dependent epimerase/dehydratase family protein [Bryobacteraceae bacterium]
MAKILVTGGAGYIGSHTVHFLRKSGHSVVVVDNLSRGDRANVPEGILRVVDLRDTGKLAAILKEEQCQAVIHFAAYISVGEST